MAPRFNGEPLGVVELIEMFVKEETALNVATSALVIEPATVVPGKVAAPVLQLFSVPVASHTPLVGAALQFALAACATCAPSGESPAVARPRTRNRRRTNRRVGNACFMSLSQIEMTPQSREPMCPRGEVNVLLARALHTFARTTPIGGRVTSRANYYCC